ncbi:amidohydrolase family protein [Nocardioides sp. GY 10127]|uniref:amidohydrolase family protein n=1 Tax=Nocardioides sp. GY 10127 TaxID=2569762 RepID=UPI0010A86D5D|nr:amidohydrolase family protein [Nocardioides sp. GY 10127]TIC79340.1 hydrolase [Nocardioides sp. GY 10127]
MSTAAGVPVVDAHLHVWDLARDGYPWLTPDLGPLHRTHVVGEVEADLDALGIDAVVLVQAEDSEDETDHLLAVADASDRVAGVVGWLDLASPGETADGLARRLEAGRLAPCTDAVAREVSGGSERRSRGRLVGVRHLVHDDPRPDFLLLPPVLESLALLADLGLPLDVPDAFPRHLEQVAAVAAQVPGLTVVVDHLAKPPRGEDRGTWLAQLAAAARHPGVVAKVSGLADAVDPYDAAGLRPLWETALELFGPDRLLWGSDWPMDTARRGYAESCAPLLALADELAPAERAAVLGGTAARVYSLPSGGIRSESGPS